MCYSDYLHNTTTMSLKKFVTTCTLHKIHRLELKQCCVFVSVHVYVKERQDWPQSQCANII